MEYPFTVPGLEVQGITVWDAGALVQLSGVDFHQLRNLLEDFGQRSAIAQGLRAPITDIWRLRSSDQRLYLQTAAAPAGCCIVLGGLKVGRKKLFLHRAKGAIVEVEPLCVLDFYVHEDHQRQGVGKELFEYMLEAEQLGAEQLGYDRPSSKLLAFLHRHYGLSHYVPQPNNFVVYEQFFEHMPTSPGRSSKGSSSVNSSGNWGTGALSSLGHGRQTLHIIGSRAAAASGADPGVSDQWLRTSLRPPTASREHCVQLRTAAAVPGLACSTTNTAAAGAQSPTLPWSPLGGPGCPPAGTPTRKGDWDELPVSPTGAANTLQQPLAQQQQQAQQLQQPTNYSRGAGIKPLLNAGQTDEQYSHARFQQALLAAAANPVPPRSKAGPMPFAGKLPQQQQQQQQYGSSGGSSCDSCMDSLDRFVGAAAACNGSSGGGACATCSYSPQTGNTSSWPAAANTYGGQGLATGRAGGASARWQQQQQQQQVQPYAVTAPFGSWEPRPGSLLPQDSLEPERVSLRRQAAMMAQQRLQQQKPAWVTAGAGPPGHLLTAPVGTYAVPTAGMADVIGKVDPAALSGRQQQQQQQQLGRQPGEADWGGSSARQSQSRGANSLCLSWDGLPTSLKAAAPQGMVARSVEAAAGWGACTNNAAGFEARSVAAAHWNGSGAASCLRMV